jgi:hypothetical protein
VPRRRRSHAANAPRATSTQPAPRQRPLSGRPQPHFADARWAVAEVETISMATGQLGIYDQLIHGADTRDYLSSVCFSWSANGGSRTQRGDRRLRGARRTADSRHRRDHARATDVREDVPGGVKHPQPPSTRPACRLPPRSPAASRARRAVAPSFEGQKPKSCSVQVVLGQCVEGGDRGGAGRVDMGATR